MGERTFKPGVYTHFKKGTKYVAYETTTAEETELPRISYFAIDNPDKKWNRKQEVFLDVAAQDESNTTGQQFKFEYSTNGYCVFNKKHDVEIIHALMTLHVTDVVHAITVSGTFVGRLKAISETGIVIYFNDTRHVISWSDMRELYKIYE